MPNFAVLENTSIINTIVADNKDIAEQITGKTCIEFTTEPAEPGGTYVNGIFLKIKPYPSWVLNEFNHWVAPVEYPEIDPENFKLYNWDESTISWVEV